MMYFDYNPITGLQYFSGEPDIFLDINMTPDVEIDANKWLKLVKEMGVVIIDSTKPINSEIKKYHKIWTNINFC